MQQNRQLCASYFVCHEQAINSLAENAVKLSVEPHQSNGTNINQYRENFNTQVTTAPNAPSARHFFVYAAPSRPAGQFVRVYRPTPVSAGARTQVCPGRAAIGAVSRTSQPADLGKHVLPSDYTDCPAVCV